MLQLIRDSNATAGIVEKLAVCSAFAGGLGPIVVTAVRDAEGNLRLIAWGETASSSGGAVITRKGDAAGGAIAEVAVDAIQDSTKVVAAVRTASDELKLIVWDISENAASFIRRGVASSPGKIKGRVAFRFLGLTTTGTAVTAVRLQSGNLRLQSWKIADDGSIQLKGSVDAGAADDLALVWPDEGVPHETDERRVLVVLRDGNGNLKLIHWLIDSAGTFTRLAEASAGMVTGVAACPSPYRIIDNNHGRIIVTAVLTGGKLELIAWKVAGDGKITRKGSSVLTAATQVALGMIGVPGDLAGLITAIRDESGNLGLALWNIKNDYSQFVNEAPASAGAVGDVALATISWSSVATALRLGSGDLKMITWHAAAT